MNTLRLAAAATTALALLAAAAAASHQLFEPAAASAPAAAGAAAAPQAETAAALPATAAPADTAGAAFFELRQRVAQLDADVRDLRRHLAHSSVVPASATAVDAATDGRSRRRDAPPPAAETEAADRALAESRDAGFRAEPLDARWSRDTAGKVQQALQAADGDGAASVRAMECRSRTCRLELAAADPSRLDAFMPDFANRIAATLGSIAASPVTAADGTHALVLYLSR